MSEMKSISKHLLIHSTIIILISVSIIPQIPCKTIFTIEEQSSFVTESTAIHIANQTLCALHKESPFTIKTPAQIINNNNQICGYIYSLQPQGYIVVSSSKELPPIIAYSFQSEFELPLPSNNQFFQLLQYDLTLRFNAIDNLPPQIIQERQQEWDLLLNPLNTINKDRYEQWPPENSTPTEGWILTNWHQNAPYNNFCPIDLSGGQRSLAGCPAVAMAQILHYHQTTNNVTFTDDDDYYHNYGGNQYWIDDDSETYDFPSYPLLNNYLDILANKYENNDPLDNNDKASLTFACGVAAHQVFNPSGSGTFGVNQAFDAYTKFNFENHTLLDESNPDLYPRLKANIKNATPAHLAVVNPDWTAGHNLVIDGYNTNDFYHLNFGWGGSYNGWYLLPDDLPYDLTVIEGIIINLYHNESTEEKINITIDKNWNFFSIPLNQSIDKSQLMITYNHMNYSWDQAITSGIINEYIFGWDRLGQYYTFANTFNPGYGYWMFSYENCTLSLDNLSIDYDEYITMTESGWNTFGIPYDQSVNKDELIINDESWNTAVNNGWISNYVFEWNREGQYYDFTDNFNPGFCYWIYTSDICNLQRIE
jgi:hypothetical protein